MYAAVFIENVPEGSYAQIFKNISRMISTQKASRYTAGQLIALNRKKESDYSREMTGCADGLKGVTKMVCVHIAQR